MLHVHPDLIEPAFVVGVANAGIYSVLAVALVLTYKISRTVGFLHYGIAVVGGYGYYGFTVDAELSGAAALFVVIAIGTLIGGAFGVVVTDRRIAFLPKITLSTVSLAAMLIVVAAATLSFPVRPDVAIPVSPFGEHRFQLFQYNVTLHRVMILVITVAMCFAISAWLNHTRAGVNVRAISDDVEAARWAGIRLFQVGICAWAASGALAALSGGLLAPIAGTDLASILLVFFRALTVAVIGGFHSPGLALAGAVVLSLTESFMKVGVFGDVGPGAEEMVILAVMVATAILVARFRSGFGHKLQVEVL
jgi:branched-subunit amino acid ABC-type transport system permease component